MGHIDDAADAVLAASELVKEALPPLVEANGAASTVTDWVHLAQNTVNAGTEMACSSGADGTQWRRRQEQIHQRIGDVAGHQAAAQEAIEDIQRLVGAFAGMLDTDAANIRMTGN